MDNNNTPTADTLVLDKKLQIYGRNDDFVAPRELTVTITLAEYRALVGADAKNSSEYDKLQKEKWALESENKKLKEALEALRPVCPMNSTKEPTDNNKTEE